MRKAEDKVTNAAKFTEASLKDDAVRKCEDKFRVQASKL